MIAALRAVIRHRKVSRPKPTSCQRGPDFLSAIDGDPDAFLQDGFGNYVDAKMTIALRPFSNHLTKPAVL